MGYCCLINVGLAHWPGRKFTLNDFNPTNAAPTSPAANLDTFLSQTDHAFQHVLPKVAGKIELQLVKMYPITHIEPPSHYCFSQCRKQADRSQTCSGPLFQVITVKKLSLGILS